MINVHVRNSKKANDEKGNREMEEEERNGKSD
jgi:hypothetical protein